MSSVFSLGPYGSNSCDEKLLYNIYFSCKTISNRDGIPYRDLIGNLAVVLTE
jgi:hypothetical protein